MMGVSEKKDGRKKWEVNVRGCEGEKVEKVKKV